MLKKKKESWGKMFLPSEGRADYESWKQNLGSDF